MTILSFMPNNRLSGLYGLRRVRHVNLLQSSRARPPQFLQRHGNTTMRSIRFSAYWAFFYAASAFSPVHFATAAEGDARRLAFPASALAAELEGDGALYDEHDSLADETGLGLELDPASWINQDGPLQPRPPVTSEFGLISPTAAEAMTQSIFSPPDVRRSLLYQGRRNIPFGSGTEFVFGSEGRFRVTTDGGNLLGKSLFAPSVKVQQRTPIVTDPRVRSARAGRLLASGSYWAPARQDLDTLMSKIDSRLISNMVVIKGPYSVRYGPGTNFIDFQLLETPRYDGGHQWNGSTSVEYKTNGEQFYGRDMAWGGGENYGYRVSYGHRTGNDYRDGSGMRLPSSYNSRDLDVALGYDFSDVSHLEFNYLRLDQTGVEFPGLVYDINTLFTNGYELSYTLEDQPSFDLMRVDGWYNRTQFTGDTSRAGKTRQIPTVNFNHGLVPAPGVVPGPGQFLLTNVDGMSAGYRVAMTWGEPDADQLTVGTDLNRQGTQLNDIVPAHTEIFIPFPGGPIIQIPVPEQNFPIPRSRSMDVGLFADKTRAMNDRLTINVGTRVDFVAADADNITLNRPAGPISESEYLQAGLNQHFTPWAAYLSANYDVNACWTLTASAGHAVRPPDLTELYATGSFMGVLQPGQTYIVGDPEIDAEKHTQIDLAANGDFGRTRLGASGFFAWVNDYIVYDVFELKVGSPVPGDPFVPGADLLGVALGNTDLATLTGFELYAEHDLRDGMTAFAVGSYLEGRDHSRNQATRMGEIRRSEIGLGGAPRSYSTNGDEPLPGISPLQARVGFRFHEQSDNPMWGWEIEALMVDRQNRVATSLFERQTSGYTIGNVRGFWRPNPCLTLMAGVENFTDNRYRTHLDYRPGLGVYQPGVNFYTSAELQY